MYADTSRQRDAAEVLAAHLTGTRYEHLPDSVVRAVKASILDTLGCVLAGTACADVVTIAELVESWAEKPVSSLIGSGGVRASPAGAVLVNGAAIHQYDFDDTHDRATCHPTASSLVPALALAQAMGGVTGKDLILAVALGNEVTSRVSLAIEGKVHDYPWFRAPVVGLFGATAAAATLLGANREQHLNALGLALPMVGGTFASLHHPGSSVRSIRDGLAYRNGVLAAELAMRGIRGDREVFEGPFGFYHAYFGGRYDRDKLIGELGERHEAARISLKPWPSIRHLHATLTAVLDVMERQKLSFADVASVDVAVGRINLDRCYLVSARVTSDDHIDLLGNLNFAVANAILHRDLPLAVYRDPALAQRVVDTAMPKVRWHHDSRQDGPWSFEPGRVEITTVVGETHRGECLVALGHPENPMTEARRRAKFLACTRNAAGPMTEARASEIVALFAQLEELDSIDPLFRCLA